MTSNEKNLRPQVGDLIFPKSREGRLLQHLRSLNGESTLTGLGLIIDVRYPMMNDTGWTDHCVMWLDSGEITIEWGGDLKVFSRPE